MHSRSRAPSGRDLRRSNATRLLSGSIGRGKGSRGQRGSPGGCSATLRCQERFDGRKKTRLWVANGSGEPQSAAFLGHDLDIQAGLLPAAGTVVGNSPGFFPAPGPGGELDLAIWVPHIPHLKLISALLSCTR